MKTSKIPFYQQSGTFERRRWTQEHADGSEKDVAVLVIEVIALIFLVMVCFALLWFLFNLWKKWLREFERRQAYQLDFLVSRERQRQGMEEQRRTTEQMQRSDVNLMENESMVSQHSSIERFQDGRNSQRGQRAQLNVNRNRNRRVMSRSVKKYINGTNFLIAKTFPEKTYHKLKETLIRMKDRKYFVQECVICIDPIHNQSKCRMLSCFHIFHSQCIDSWLLNTASCPMCNKIFKTAEDIKIDLKEHQMNSISVDNEYFYSDHIVVRKPDVLPTHELRKAFQYAMPHEYQDQILWDRNKSHSDQSQYSHHSSWDDKSKVLRPRKRSQSTDMENELMHQYNVKNKFGKALFDISNQSVNILVGPLKIIRLPSDRSAPRTINTRHLSRTPFAFSGYNSIKGSVPISPKNKSTMNPAKKILSTRNSPRTSLNLESMPKPRYGANGLMTSKVSLSGNDDFLESVEIENKTMKNREKQVNFINFAKGAGSGKVEAHVEMVPSKMRNSKNEFSALMLPAQANDADIETGAKRMSTSNNSRVLDLKINIKLTPNRENEAPTKVKESINKEIFKFKSTIKKSKLSNFSKAQTIPFVPEMDRAPQMIQEATPTTKRQKKPDQIVINLLQNSIETQDPNTRGRRQESKGEPMNFSQGEIDAQSQNNEKHEEQKYQKPEKSGKSIHKQTQEIVKVSNIK